MFAGRSLCIATMHKKEQVIAPVLEKELHVHCFTSPDLNTDFLGTFSGEIRRTETPLETARQKCLSAIKLTGTDLAVSSEGSFGPHPAIGFVPCNEELLFFYDATTKIEIYTSIISLKTNYASAEFTHYEKAREFAEECLFPSHGLLIKDANEQVIEKGITDWKQLETAFNKAKQKGQAVKIETDMRAHFNPTRMHVIKECASKLATAINLKCPQCQWPGFTANRAEPGLPCNLCKSPTRSVLKHISVCKHCFYVKETLYPYQKTTEDPMYCDNCNP